jgi:hypothetical protein
MRLVGQLRPLCEPKNVKTRHRPSHSRRGTASAAAVENWLRDEVARSYDEYAADPNIGIPASEVTTRLRSSYRARPAKPGS